MHADASITGKACVIDGDSLAVGGRLNNEQWCRSGVQVRISGIDAPEWNQTCTDAAGKEWACGKAAKKAMARLVEGKNVVCQERLRDVPAAEVRFQPQSRRKLTPAGTAVRLKSEQIQLVAGCEVVGFGFA